MRNLIIFVFTFLTIISPVMASSNIVTSFSDTVVRIETEYTQSSFGMIIMNGGYVITPAETVEDTKDIKIKTNKGGRFNAKVVGIDKYNNLALLRVPAFYGKKINYINLNPSPLPSKNNQVIFYKNKMNKKDMPFVKIIETNEKVTIDKEEYYFNLLKTDGELEYEDSGTPVLNEKNEIIGMSMSFEEKNTNYKKIPYILPVNTVIKSAKELKLYGEKQYPVTGIEKVSKIGSKFLVNKLKLPNRNCFVVEKIRENSPADISGIKSGIGVIKNNKSIGLSGDIILTIDEYTFKSAKELFRYINSKFAGDILTLDIIRNTNKHKIPITLGEINE